MRKKFFVISSLVAVGILSICFVFAPLSADAATQPVSLSTTILSYLSFNLTAGSTIAFGSLTPGTPICSATATIASVTTNSANGYTLGLSDSIAAANSSLVHTDTTTYIPDMTNGTIATPVVWGSNTGLGVGMFAADTTKEVSWGTGTTVCDALNKYSAVPQNATTAHTVTGFRSTADTSSWSWKIDTLNTQKTGSYSGTDTFTVTAVLT